MLRRNAALDDDRADACATPNKSQTTTSILPGSSDAESQMNPDSPFRLQPVGGVHLTNSNKMSDDADGKRPKLSYQRTIIACGHCRRRKIRCMPSEVDGQPCSMCLKLKKECIYAPVTSPTNATPSKGPRLSVKKKKAGTAPVTTSAPSVSSTTTTSSQASSSPQATSSYGQDQNLSHIAAAREGTGVGPSITPSAHPLYMSHMAQHPAIAPWNPQVEAMPRGLSYSHDPVYAEHSYDQYEFATGGATGYVTAQHTPLQTLYSPDPSYTPQFWQTGAPSVPQLNSEDQEAYVPVPATMATAHFSDYTQSEYEQNLHHPNEVASYSVPPTNQGMFDPALYTQASPYIPHSWTFAPDVTSDALAEHPPNSPNGRPTEPG